MKWINSYAYIYYDEHLKEWDENRDIYEALLASNSVREFIEYAVYIYLYEGNYDMHDLYDMFVELDGRPYKKVRDIGISVKEWRKISSEVFKRDRFKCVYCGVVGGKLEVDHIIPYSRGGSNAMSNLATACRHCNRQKHDKTAEEFIEWRKRKGL